MSDAATELREHLVARHPGAQMPWFTGSGYIEQMRSDQLERLHDVLHDQGDVHMDEVMSEAPAAPVVVRGPCRLSWCRALAARPDGLCLAHGVEADKT